MIVLRAYDILLTKTNDMSKERAIEIVKNLNGTISKMKDKSIITSTNEMFKTPSVHKRELLRRRDRLIKKHNLTANEISTNN